MLPLVDGGQRRAEARRFRSCASSACTSTARPPWWPSRRWRTPWSRSASSSAAWTACASRWNWRTPPTGSCASSTSMARWATWKCSAPCRIARNCAAP
ncbi:hypothetical protein HML84_04280 [Alcanivorax sp. IO_7]|nr:hypothetical protein HML84_04280 [Alcanivorax sp. IO_7]